MLFRRIFTAHPASVDESYGEHLKVASHFAYELATAAAACAVHALVPAACTRTASSKVIALHHEMTTGNRAANTVPTQPRPADVAPLQPIG